MKHKKPQTGFEHVSPCAFRTTVNITARTPLRNICNDIKRIKKNCKSSGNVPFQFLFLMENQSSWVI